MNTDFFFHSDTHFLIGKIFGSIRSLFFLELHNYFPATYRQIERVQISMAQNFGRGPL